MEKQNTDPQTAIRTYYKDYMENVEGNESFTFIDKFNSRQLKRVIDPSEVPSFNATKKDMICELYPLVPELTSPDGNFDLGCAMGIADSATSLHGSILDRDHRIQLTISLKAEVHKEIKVGEIYYIHCVLEKMGKNLMFSYFKYYNKNLELAITGYHIKVPMKNRLAGINLFPNKPNL